ncbi:SIS domain-containing protein [Paenibacillus sp. GCM10023252]|uniref:SIS domain-containing protein n=1 Tax=Paenibacillus sp. GCM10023252 TaxID=3252649 RepID=UPI00360D5FCE
MRSFHQDLLEQPEVLKMIAAYYGSDEGRSLLQACAGIAKESKRIIFTGMGSSYAASRLAGSYLATLGVAVSYQEASELLHYGMNTLGDESLLVLISQSGESIEIRQILQQLPPSVCVISITNDSSSTLSRGSKLVLPLFAGEESTTSSKTYTATLAVTLLLCGSIAGLDPRNGTAFVAAASRRLRELESELQHAPWSQIAEWLQEANAVYLIGRGPGVTTAFQGALTFKELVKFPAEYMEAAQFRHGPLETVNERTVVFVFASPGRTSELLYAFAEELRQCGAKVIVIEQGGIRLEGNASYVQQPTPSMAEPVLDECFATLVDIYPVQLAASGLAERLGISGQFRWITKVTKKE